MSTTRKVAVFVGSPRKGSFNRMTAKVLAALAPAELQLEIVEIGQLPLYNQDDDDNGAPRPEWVAFRERVRAADAVLFVTPENIIVQFRAFSKTRLTWVRALSDKASGTESPAP